MYCKHCGKQIDDNSSFCKYCGKQLKESKKIVIEFNNPNISEKVKQSRDFISKTYKSNTPKIKKIIIKFFFFILLSFAWLVFPCSAFLVLSDFFDISQELCLVLAVLSSMTIAGVILYKSRNDLGI